MRVMLANAPAFFGHDPYRRYLQGGCRFAPSAYVNRNVGDPNFRYRTFPFGLAYGYSYLKCQFPDIDLKWLDGVALDMNDREWLSAVRSASPDLLVVEGTTSSFNRTLDLLAQFKATNPHSKVVCAGWHASGAWDTILSIAPYVDFVFLHEYEETLVELVARNLDPEMLPGIAYRHGTKVALNPRRAVVMDLDRYPFPYRERATIGRYYDAMKPEYGHPSIQMWTSRGCPIGCSFCFSHMAYSDRCYRPRDARRVVDEMEHCKEEFGAKQFYFDDDTVTINRTHIAKLCTEIRERGDFVWSCMGDVTLSKDGLATMRRSGCVALKIGVESIHPDAIGKSHVTPERVMKFRKWCKDIGMWVHAQFMLGFPNDTRESLQATLKFIEKLHPDTFQIYGASPLPGTPFYAECVANGWLKGTVDEWDMLDADRPLAVSYPHLSSAEIYEYVQRGKRLNERNLARYQLKRGISKILSSPTRLFSGDWSCALRYIRMAL